ncbi:hypothetical protein ACFY7Y_35770 [Streptomyces virginiae]|uniref:hypothetical protein n=1 Tax=Streptomyces virginiae TaxID=1961 RepID=UPI000A753732|nr:hypothetical protein [Streptomyces virginiae]
MIEIADVREWRTHDVVDAAGRKIGVLAKDEAAVFAHHGRPYQPGVNGERRLARR